VSYLTECGDYRSWESNFCWIYQLSVRFLLTWMPLRFNKDRWSTIMCNEPAETMMEMPFVATGSVKGLGKSRPWVLRNLLNTKNNDGSKLGLGIAVAQRIAEITCEINFAGYTTTSGRFSDLDCPLRQLRLMRLIYRLLVTLELMMQQLWSDWISNRSSRRNN